MIEEQIDTAGAGNKVAVVKTTVKDSGRDMSQEDQAKLFTPYSQVNPLEQNFKGTGLG